ncbi:MAG: hypothetical protein V4436_03275 [Patescibacteria group bacterium]
MRDMAPRGDRSIRNIPVSSAHKKRPTRFEAQEYEEEVEEVRPRRRRKRGSRLFVLSAIVIAIVFGVLGLLLSTLFAGASVTVYPRVATLAPTITLSAQPNAPAGTLAYQTLTITSSATTSVPASGSQKVSRQASGAITIYNSYSGETQRLIANTRFEAPDGKIYRIHDSVVVPGMQGSVPGTANITVYADSPGAEYNKGATRFTVPGFKSDPRYTKFYAEAASISNGFVGNEPAVAQADLDAAKATMASKLEEAARNSFASQIPDGFTAVENTYQFSFSDLRQAPEGSGKASLSQTLTATVAVVRLSDVAALAAKQSVDGYTGEAVAFTNPKETKVSAAAGTKPLGKIDVTVTGASGVVWQYDKNAIKAALLGKKKTDFEAIITSFRPALTGAEVTLRPFWQSNLPSDPSKITVTEGVKK